MFLFYNFCTPANMAESFWLLKKSVLEQQNLSGSVGANGQ